MSEPPFLWWLGQHLLITTILALIVWLVCRIARPSAAACHVLWLLVLLRMMIPPAATWPWSIPSPFETSVSAAPAESGSRFDLARPSSPEVVSVVDVVPVLDGSRREAATTLSELPRPASRRETAMGSQLSADAFLAGLWGVGSLAAVMILVLRIRRVRLLLKRGTHVEGWLEDDVAGWSRRLAVRRPQCLVTDAVRSPLLWCLGRVRLVWPAALGGSAHQAVARPILVHELAHLKRRDHWTAWLETAALAVWWWNPVYWFARRELRAAAEMACDAWVVELLPDQRRSYAESLVELSRHGRAPQLAVGANSGPKRNFERRLEMIVRGDSATRMTRWIAVFAVLLGAVSLPVFAIEPAEPSDAQEEAAAEERTSDEQEIADLVAEVNQLYEAQRYAEAAAVARQARVRFPEQTVAAILVSRLELVENLKGLGRDEAESGAYEPDESENGLLAQNDRGESAPPDRSATLDEVLEHIESKYYGEFDRRDLERVAIEAVLSKLDNRSTLMSKTEYENLTTSIDGELEGVGIAINLSPESEQPVVARAIRNSPAEHAGLKRDDIILSIDGQSTENLDLPQIVRLIRGPRGSAVVLQVERADETLEVKVVRERFETLTVNPWSVSEEGGEQYWADREAGIGYVHIPTFTRNTASQMQSTLTELTAEGMQGLVLDLRDCHGGLLSAAVDLVDMFIDEGVILTSQGRSTAETTTFRASAGGAYVDLPLAVLVNGETASAAEIVAAALQDHHRAAIIGQQTFGRGTVQSVFQLQGGGALRLTTAAWLRPNGRSLLRREGRDTWGVQPDAGWAVAVEDELAGQLAQQREERLNGKEPETPVADPQLEMAVDALKSQ